MPVLTGRWFFVHPQHQTGFMAVCAMAGLKDGILNIVRLWGLWGTVHCAFFFFHKPFREVF